MDDHSTDTDEEEKPSKPAPRRKEPPFNRAKFIGDTPLGQMILALSDEIEFAEKNLQTQTLKNGDRAGEMGGLFLYRFGLDRQFDFEPDESLAVAVNGIDYRGKVAQVNLSHVVIGIEKDHGELLAKVVIAKAENVIEKLLRKQLVEVFDKTTPFHHDQANFVIGTHTATVVEAPIPSVVPAFLNAQEPAWKLNKEQERLIEIAQESDYTILWGPPGCGKTAVIGLLAVSFLAEGKRMLVASNANKAVDGALGTILETQATVARMHPSYDGEKTIIRPGGDGITQEFRDKWGEQALLEEVVKARTVEITKERDDLTREKARLDPELRQVRAGLATYEDFHAATQRAADLPGLYREASDQAKQYRQDIANLDDVIRGLETEYAKAPEEQTLKTRLGFGRSREAVQGELVKTRRQRKAAENDLEKAEDSIAALVEEMKSLEVRLVDINGRVADLASEAELKDRLGEIEPRVAAIVDRLAEIAKELDDMADKVLREADVIGTTVHKSFLDPTLSKLDFDVVVIDEASMVVLPMTYWAAGRSKKQVVIVGDFKQLPAIVKNNDSELVAEWMAKTPFDKCGIRKAVKEHRNGKPLPDNLVALREQNRMHDEIGRLVSDHFYEGSLITGQRVLSRPLAPRLPGQKTDKRLLLIDTKDIGAWSSPPFSGKGRFNPTHAALALSLIDKMVLDGLLTGEGKSAMERIGFVTPYAGQAELLLKATEEKYRALIHSSSIGTAHRFQGSERSIMVFDYVMSEGRTRRNLFLDSSDGEDQPANLLNVALSRAKEQLVLIYNSEDFGERGTTEWMRRFLSDYAGRAEHLSARDLLDESDLLGKVRDLAHGREFKVEGPTTLHDETGFYAGVRQDLMEARQSVVIFSAFATPKNLSRWMDAFQSLLERGIKIRIVTKPISQQPNSKHIGGHLRSMFDICRRAGMTVDMRTVTHEKAIVIDNRTVWHGSLNMLSQERDRTTELMTRTISKDFADQMLKLLSRHDLKQPDSSLPQLPVCPTCAGPSSLVVSWNGKEHLVCENGCGYITGKRNFASLVRGIPIGRHLGACPECADGIVKFDKSWNKTLGKCSNGFAKKGARKCSYETPVSLRDLQPYEPYPPANPSDPSVLQEANSSFTDEPPSPEEAKPQTAPHAAAASGKSKKKGGKGRKQEQSDRATPRQKMSRPKTTSELDDFLSSLT
ncbi:AAA domain-containing protein [Magnetospira sp. QH-2]|uniref:AAA domain-containing protein n=1 Tax=Magnetospira sp. (strain QH-2) TaxID=1288970 RepID=UPI0003E80E69|nr:AAA domain-containing protein [Magnetospira sp. QH-2]CCQ74221.1 Protein of unknown function [Magnetospira sp. QH-2]